MQLRESLGKIDLTGTRRIVRHLSTWAIAAFAALGALGYVLLQQAAGHHHAVRGNFSLALFAVVIGLALGLRNRQLGSGIFTGVIAIVGSFLALGPVLFSHHGHGAGESVFALGVLGMFLGGLALILSEPILFVLERRERRRTPQLPLARVFA